MRLSLVSAVLLGLWGGAAAAPVDQVPLAEKGRHAGAHGKPYTPGYRDPYDGRIDAVGRKLRPEPYVCASILISFSKFCKKTSQKAVKFLFSHKSRMDMEWSISLQFSFNSQKHLQNLTVTEKWRRCRCPRTPKPRPRAPKPRHHSPSQHRPRDYPQHALVIRRLAYPH